MWSAIQTSPFGKPIYLFYADSSRIYLCDALILFNFNGINVLLKEITKGTIRID